jgi:hypothetical protein
MAKTLQSRPDAAHQPGSRPLAHLHLLRPSTSSGPSSPPSGWSGARPLTEQGLVHDPQHGCSGEHHGPRQQPHHFRGLNGGQHGYEHRKDGINSTQHRHGNPISHVRLLIIFEFWEQSPDCVIITTFKILLMTKSHPRLRASPSPRMQACFSRFKFSNWPIASRIPRMPSSASCRSVVTGI